MKTTILFYKKWNDELNNLLEDKILELGLENNIYIVDDEKHSKKVDIIYIDNLEDITVYIYKKSIVLQVYNTDIKKYGLIRIK